MNTLRSNVTKKKNRELATAISATPGLTVIAWCDNIGFVHNELTDVMWNVEVDRLTAPIDQQIAVLKGKREPMVLDHFTRIVGYFSKVKNWNQGKIGELRDRQRGDYSIESNTMELPVCEQK